MDKKEMKKCKDKQTKLNDLYDDLKQEIGSSSMDIVSEIVELEIELEAISNQ